VGVEGLFVGFGLFDGFDDDVGIEIVGEFVDGFDWVG